MADEDTPVEAYPFEFRALVVRELENNGLALKEWQNDGMEVEDEEGKVRYVGLANLYRRVITNPAELSGQLVQEFFRNAQVADATQYEQIPDSLDASADKVRVRIGRPFAEVEHAPWQMPVEGAEDLAVCLVLDFPTMMAFVTPAMATASSLPIEHWLAQGLNNLRESAPEGWLKLVQPDEGIYLGHENDSYDAARALVICDLTQSDDLGWMVCIPARDWLFARKVDREGLNYFHLLKVVGERAYAEQPYPISPEVYWVRPGFRWELFSVRIEGQQVTVAPTQEFADLLGLTVADERDEAE